MTIIIQGFIILANTGTEKHTTVAIRGSVFIGFMTPAGAIWSIYQKAV